MRSSMRSRMPLAASESESATDCPSHCGQAIVSARLRARSPGERGPPSSSVPYAQGADHHHDERGPPEQAAAGHEPSPPDAASVRAAMSRSIMSWVTPPVYFCTTRPFGATRYDSGTLTTP